MTTFRELAIGQTFDWVNDAAIGSNSFFRPCTKVSARKYVDDQGTEYRVGSVNATVYHVGVTA
jgi:hypothetical protein